MARERRAGRGVGILNLVDRFTRDRISRVVWGLCFLVAIGLLAFAVVGGGRAEEDQRGQAEARASAYATTIVKPSIEDVSLEEPIQNGALEQLILAVDSGILVDGRVVAVRLWASDGTLLFSTLDSDRPGDAQSLNDEQLRVALTDAAPVTISERSSAEDPQGASELITYVPVASTAGAEAVVEVVQDFEATVGAIEGDWFLVQLLAGALALIFLVLTMLSFREPVAKIGAGVGFVAEAVPRGFAVIEEDRFRAVNDVYALAQERVVKLKERLAESEQARLATEGELQRILSKFETPKRASVAGTFPAPVAEEPVAEEPVAEEPVAEEPVAEEPVAVEPVAEEPVAEEPVAEEPVAEEPVAEEPVAEEPVAEEPVAEEPVAEEPVAEEPVAEEPVAVEPVAEEPVAEEPVPIVIPESEEAPAARVAASAMSEIVGLEDDDEDDAMIARELLLRLMETEVPLADTGVDPGEIRAKLARTAARKKPGGGERRLVEEEPARQTPPWARDR